jgi:hypothetical protein
MLRISLNYINKIFETENPAHNNKNINIITYKHIFYYYKFSFKSLPILENILVRIIEK